jgi:adenine-specific DNA methylase
MIINKSWAMPNKNTFQINPIKNLIDKYNCVNLFNYKNNFVSIDPFANNNKLTTITNDLDPQFNTDYNLDALDFLKKIKTQSVDLLLFDPPYSTRQVSECYKKLGRTVNIETTQSTFWTKLKKEISRITKKDSKVISFGWNSGGIGKDNGFEQIEILLVAHGGIHNDTICVVENKFK